MHQAKKYVFRAYVVVAQESGLFLGKNQYPTTPIREALEHGTKATGESTVPLPVIRDVVAYVRLSAMDTAPSDGTPVEVDGILFREYFVGRS